jgi:membrane fusion protein, multidrug efflux system
MSRSRVLSFTFLIAIARVRAQPELASVSAKPISRSVDLPGELQPWLSVSVHARVAGIVEQVLVDRGSVVQKGQLLAELNAPEMQAHIAEAESKVQAEESDRLQAEAQLAAIQATFERLQKAAQTPGAIAENEIVQLQKQIQAGEALIQSRQQAGRAAAQSLRALQDLQSYLRIAAPFDGVITDRFVHPGALVGPGEDSPLLVLQQISTLRLVVACPEEDVGMIAGGAKVDFRVPAFPERVFSGVVARAAHAVDQKTRTMAVELDVMNAGGALSPGMYATVKWPVKRSQPALLVPRTSVVTTTERTFVIRENNGRAEWVDVKTGPSDGDLIEVIGQLHVRDRIVKRATDEIRDGSPLQAGK